MSSDDTHKCPAGGCGKRVRPDMLMCAPHWYAVPRPLRSAVWRAWDGGAGAASPEHAAAIRAAIKAVNRA
jgi:hypothetical protein